MDTQDALQIEDNKFRDFVRANKHVGFGNMMKMIADIWAEQDDFGAKTVGDAISVVKAKHERCKEEGHDWSPGSEFMWCDRCGQNIDRSIFNERDMYKNMIHVMKQLSFIIYSNAKDHGFWDDGANRNKGELIALMHSELSEALEGLRGGDPPDRHRPNFKNHVIELADCVIRIFDYAAAFNLPLAEAIIAKHEYNRTRPRKHGKAF